MKKVYMYTLSTCPWCRKAKKYFTEHGIAFDFIDYDLADEATQDKIINELEAHGANGFPFVRIGDQVVEGYQPDRYAELFGI
ncbi:MAG: glutaredoxin domain-containing protein [Rectinema sp.]